MLEPNPSVLVTHQGLTTRITLNRPDRLNAVTIPMMQRLLAALDEAADRQSRCVVLTGIGRGFCAGQDLRVLTQFYEHHPPAELGDIIQAHYQPVIERITHLPMPVLAAVQGVAAGAGWSLALACDCRLAAASARFVPAFAPLGLIPDLGGTVNLVQAVGLARAMEFTLLTEALPADEACAWGLVNRVVPDDQLQSTADDWARRVSRLSPIAVALTKKAMRAAAAALNQSAALDQESAWQALAAQHPDHAAGVRSFTRN